MPENPVATELADVRTLAPLARARIIMFGMTRHWAQKNVCVFWGKINGGECLSMAVVCGATFSLGKECHFRLRKAKKWQKTMTINQAAPKKIVPRLHYIALFGNEHGKAFCSVSCLGQGTGSDFLI